MNNHTQNDNNASNSIPEKIVDLGHGYKVTSEEAKSLLFSLMDQYVSLAHKYIELENKLEKLQSEQENLENNPSALGYKKILLAEGFSWESFKMKTQWDEKPICFHILDKVWPDHTPFISEQDASNLGGYDLDSLEEWSEDNGVIAVKREDTTYYPWPQVEALFNKELKS